MVFAVIKKFASEFDQILIVGEGSFIKKIIEDGRDEHRIDWPRLNVHLITGEEGIAENYRTYVAALLGVDVDSADSRIVGSSMGVAELDLNIFHETRDTIRVRRLAHRDPSVRKALFGTDHAFCPMLFVYYPHRCFVEELPVQSRGSELVISMLSEEMKIPLLRYRSGDFGKVLGYDHVVRNLADLHHPMKPDLHVPWVAVEGRGRALATEAGPLFPEAVKEALYRDPTIAEAITGNFRLSPTATQGKLEIQMRRGRNAPARATAIVLDALALYAGVQPGVEFQAFGDFRHNTGVDYERKFAYLS
jgi:phenylacetate-CoA ligase